jgi:hypothetical protein
MKRLNIMLGIIALGLASAQASVIAEYTFLDSDVTSSDTEANSVADNFVATGTDLGFSNSGDNAFARSQGLVGTDETAAITHGAYMSFTVSADAGYELDLTSLTYKSVHNKTNLGNDQDTDATMNFFVRSSVDSYAANVGSVFSQGWNTSTANRTIDLNGSAFQDLTSAVTFRLYVYESVQLDTIQGARWDDVVLNGTVIPEPATLGLIAFSGIGVLFIRRRLMM